ncbi:MAG TPA: 3-hexulose-6-phosphate synthase [Anaeromyxobacter sp.]|nr:3-hexulose-6-phosphate synthase [Anaeromyxobacter sp.]
MGPARDVVRIQLAIDSLRLEEGVTLVSRVRDLVDIIEVGTPLVIREGVASVRRFHQAFPEVPVLADLKIVDGGYLEASLGFEAGARMVTALATAADATIREVVRAAREQGGEVMVDLLGIEDLPGRAREVESLGANYLCLHIAVDVLGEVDDPSGAVGAGLQAVKAVLRRAGTAVAGGITPVEARSLARLSPDIVVVGSGIARAPDPRAAAAALRAALHSGGEP